MFEINDRLSVALNGKKIIGKLIGVDSYCMDNFEGKRIKWVSHTLISDLKGIFSRYWIINRGKLGWFLSTESEKIHAPKGSKIALKRSGLAQIAFVGDKGVSTPSAALLAYKINDNQYFTIERFSRSGIMFFTSQKIDKPKVVI